MQASTPDTAARLAPFIQHHIGEELRKLYEEILSEDPEQFHDHIARLREMDDEAIAFRERIRARLDPLSNTETAFLEDCTAFIALAFDVNGQRRTAYHVLCEALWTFGYSVHEPDRKISAKRTIQEWGGWPQFRGVPLNGEAEGYWFRVTMALQPKSETEWVEFVETGSAFLYVLMLRHQHNGEFWLRIRDLADGSLRFAAQQRLNAIGC